MAETSELESGYGPTSRRGDNLLNDFVQESAASYAGFGNARADRRHPAGTRSRPPVLRRRGAHAPAKPATLIASDLGRGVYERLGFVALLRCTYWLGLRSA
jgi:hypothetical protein